MRTPLCLTSLVLALAAASWVDAQGLAPDDPSISGGLQVWLKDPLGTYNPTTGVWTDSSGNGNNAGIFDDNGFPNENAATSTFTAPSSGTLTPQGGFFNGIGEVTGLEVTGVSNDLLAVLDLNPSGTGVSVGTLITVYQSDVPNNATRPAGFGSRAEVTGNGENHFHLAMDSSFRYNNGFSAGSQVHGAGLKFRASQFNNGVAFDILDGVTNIGPSSVTNNENGVPNPTASDNLFIGNLQGGINDAGANGSDFFISTVLYYDTALTASQMNDIGVWLQSNLDVIKGPSFTVNSQTGEVRLVNTTDEPITLDYYQITSASGSLNPAGFASLEDNGGGGGVGSGDGSGDGWEVIGTPSVEYVAEGLLTAPAAGGATLGVGEFLSFGQIYNTAAVNDLAVTIQSLGAATTAELVEAVSVTGDYNGDEVVNAADYTVWRDSLNSTGPGLPADGDGDMDVDADDYLVWRSAFLAQGAGVGTVLGPAVIPEPASLLICGALGLFSLSGRRSCSVDY